MAVQILPPIVVRESREQFSYSHLSHRATRHVYQACVAKRDRLILHRAKLDYWIDTEYDLFELLKLAPRLERVDTNLSRLAAQIRALEFELAKRRLRDMA